MLRSELLVLLVQTSWPSCLDRSEPQFFSWTSCPSRPTRSPAKLSEQDEMMSQKFFFM